MKKLLTSKQVKYCDSVCIKELKISEIELVKRAAKALYLRLRRYNNFLIVCGNGNNGADGLALASLLYKAKKNVDVYVFNGSRTITNAYYLKEYKGNIVNSIEDKYDVVIDGIFGIGLNKIVKDPYREIIDELNDIKGKKISIDIPSGTDASSGLILGTSFIADRTYTFIAEKTGSYLNDGKDTSKRNVAIDIGVTYLAPNVYRIERSDIRLVKRKYNVNKSTFGKCIIIGGSKFMIGAPLLSYMATTSLKSGAGYVVLAVPKSNLKAYQSRTLENMLFELDDIDGQYIFKKETAEKLVRNNPSIAIGMGMGTSEEVKKLIKYILTNSSCNLLIDADGLNSIDEKILSIPTYCNVCITPHIKEFSKLTGITIDEISNDPIFYTREFAKRTNTTVLLKGTSSIVSNGSLSYVVTNGTPALSKGGSGDVLSGIIISLLSQGYSKDQSLIYGQYLLNEMGKIAEEKLGVMSPIASDLIKELPKVFKKHYIE